METTTLYNLDNVFYAIGKTGGVAIWAVNNILTSAVGHKIVYELKNMTTGAVTTLTEAQLETRIYNKQIVKNTDDLRKVLEQTFQKLTEISIKKAEATKTKFLKEKLERTLKHNERKAETSLNSIKERLKIDGYESEENQLIDPDEVIRQAIEAGAAIYEDEFKEYTLRGKIENLVRQQANRDKCKELHESYWCYNTPQK